MLIYAQVMDQSLKQIIDVIRAEFPLKRAFLFGSRANGTANEESDYDIVFVISDSPLLPIERAQRAHSLLWDARIATPADMFFLTETEFEKSKTLFNTIGEIAFNTGIEVPLDAP